MAKSADPTQNGETVTAATESTPLLSAPESIATRPNGDAKPPHPNSHAAKPLDHETQSPSPSSETEREGDAEEEERPMPTLQILLLCYASLAEPVAYFSIFPFINEMIFRLGDLPESSVGFWTGLIESLFSLVQMALMIFYGRAADRLGRKPVLVFSLAGISVATAMFGLSQNLWQMVLARCFAGCFAGSVVTIRTMIRGSLACPTDLNHAPGAFCRAPFFAQFPYALASFVAGALCLTSTLAAQIFLKETLQTAAQKSASDPKPTPPLTTWEVLTSPGVPTVLLIFGHTMFLALAYTAVSPLYQFTSIENGGLAFSDAQIAVFIAVAGVSQAAWMLIGFPPLQRWLGTGRLLRACVAFQPFFMASYPLLNELRRHGYERAFWGTLWPTLIIGSGVAMSFACVQLALNDISPSSAVLATVNALALTVNSGIRAFTPVAFTSLYAVGVKWGWADGHLIWFVLIAVAVALYVDCWFLPKAAEGNYGRKKVGGDGEGEAR
ncbi:hypothetical protein LTR35_017549 [Friedmanniomyces endolithicus]|uniref:Major facilitator superfamily (MFS) profile domain-containing protein n=1 Tax=Friedmanniomyces endolithicus TaxID=329885 RepID=A0AAN6J4K4_9PEZI|nr:hypothetical protein LTR35_017549 [Friedmanniomyces endolithicus]KAK0269079.1 hypothetical protein LTS00_017377 [Friedmanniomyces endolithicus]KAK0317000.1 hypothetical protein LTR82_012142 [Friedmanniomyces endolithicus]